MTITPFLAGFRVLIVEDNGFVAIAYENFVDECGCTSCITAPDVTTALANLPIFQPHLVLLDIAMHQAEPDFRIADALVEQGIPFVFCTALPFSVIPERHNGRPCVSKPFIDDEMVGALQSALKLHMSG